VGATLFRRRVDGEGGEESEVEGEGWREGGEESERGEVMEEVVSHSPLASAVPRLPPSPLACASSASSSFCSTPLEPVLLPVTPFLLGLSLDGASGVSVLPGSDGAGGAGWSEEEDGACIRPDAVRAGGWQAPVEGDSLQAASRKQEVRGVATLGASSISTPETLGPLWMRNGGRCEGEVLVADGSAGGAEEQLHVAQNGGLAPSSPMAHSGDVDGDEAVACLDATEEASGTEIQSLQMLMRGGVPEALASVERRYAAERAEMEAAVMNLAAVLALEE
jgi:hypothetical protein